MLDLKTNSWEQLNYKGCPSPRSGHRMVTLDSLSDLFLMFPISVHLVKHMQFSVLYVLEVYMIYRYSYNMLTLKQKFSWEAHSIIQMCLESSCIVQL